MFDRYTLIQGFDRHEEAQDYADRLPPDAKAKVHSYSTTLNRKGYAFAVDVNRLYTGGRL